MIASHNKLTEGVRAMEISPITPHMGAEVRGVDLANLDNEQFAAIHQA